MKRVLNVCCLDMYSRRMHGHGSYSTVLWKLKSVEKKLSSFCSWFLSDRYLDSVTRALGRRDIDTAGEAFVCHSLHVRHWSWVNTHAVRSVRPSYGVWRSVFRDLGAECWTFVATDLSLIRWVHWLNLPNHARLNRESLWLSWALYGDCKV